MLTYDYTCESIVCNAIFTTALLYTGLVLLVEGDEHLACVGTFEDALKAFDAVFNAVPAS